MACFVQHITNTIDLLSRHQTREAVMPSASWIGRTAVRTFLHDQNQPIRENSEPVCPVSSKSLGEPGRQPFIGRKPAPPSGHPQVYIRIERWRYASLRPTHAFR